jgi:hypothetical protein
MTRCNAVASASATDSGNPSGFGSHMAGQIAPNSDRPRSLQAIAVSWGFLLRATVEATGRLNRVYSTTRTPRISTAAPLISRAALAGMSLIERVTSLPTAASPGCGFGIMNVCASPARGG